MIIRSAQMVTLGAYANHAFANELAEHLKLFAPELCNVVGEPGVHEIAASGIERAHSYGLTNRGPVRFFLELMSTMGSRFDTDPQIPWASQVLTDGSIPTDMLRADRLYERMLVYLDRVDGPDRRYAIAAFTRSREFDVESAPREGWSEKAVLNSLARVYPEKFEFIGESLARTIARQAAEEAAAYGLPPGKGPAVLALSKFVMGHQICVDPFYPWIAATLNDARIVDGNSRLARLVSKLHLYGTHVLAYFNPS